jgi:hypothetical protein
MQIVHPWWEFLASHWLEIVLAIVFALIADLIGIGSGFRAAMRHLRNKLAERSVARLRKRIKELETQRDRYAGFLSSDKVLYLATFRLVIGILIFLAFGLASRHWQIPFSPLLVSWGSSVTLSRLWLEFRG